MKDDQLQSWTQTLFAACALTFLVVQARTAFVERSLLQEQTENSRSLKKGLEEELAQLRSTMKEKEAQLEKATALEKKYGLLLDDLVQASRTDPDAWAITQKWKIQAAGGQPVPPPPGATVPPPAPPRGVPKPQTQSPSLNNPFIPSAKPAQPN